MSPKSFLHKLGVRPIRKPRYAQGSFPTNDGEVISNPMAPSVIDSLFASESIARETLGGNFDRIANSMERISRGAAFKNGKRQRIAELGGGAGLLGMWLASNNLCDGCDIIDHAKNPLELGKKWAAAINLPNVGFLHSSFADLANNIPVHYDFVFAEHVVGLAHVIESPPPPGTLRPEDNPLIPKYTELCATITRILSRDGLGLIGTSLVNTISLTALCSALRTHGLVIDWEASSNLKGLQLYVRHGETPLFESVEDEALAIMSDSTEDHTATTADILSFEKIFRDGDKFFEVHSVAAGVKYSCAISQYAGLACLFQTATDGSWRTTLFSASKVVELSKNALADARKREVVFEYQNPRLVQFMLGG